MKKKYFNKFILLALVCVSNLSIAQIIYQHAYGTSTFSAVNPYTVTPNSIDPNLNTSQWVTSSGAGFNSLAGSTGQALSLTNSGGTPTYSLSFNVAPGYTCSISDFSFWRQRSGTGAQNWTLTVNGATLIGAGTTPTAGINTGTVPVTNPVTGLSGTVDVVLQLGGASGTGSFRLDDFTLYGVVNPTVICTPPITQATTFSVSSIGSNSVTINWTPGSGSNVIVLASYNLPVSGSPTSGATYTANSVYGSGQQIGAGNFVVYNGTGNSSGVTGLIPGATYYFAVFEYNTTSGFPCYLTPALTGSATIGACVPPTTQASFFTTTASGTTSVSISWTAGNGGNAIVLARSTSAITVTPTSGTTYTAPSTVYGSGQQIGTGNYLVYDGTGTSVTVTNLNPGSTYYFSIFEYNTASGSPCYLTPALTGNTTALATPIPTNCLQIKSILVDACQANATNYESYNEMVYFKNGSNPLPINQLSIAGAPSSAVYALNKWPNNGNIWNGAVQNATTAANVSTINGSIIKCGYALEPPLISGVGTIPPFANVILVGSQVMNPLSNSFVNLTDTVYMIFQSVSTTTAGNFVNWASTNTGTRGLVLIDNANACTSNTVTYEPQLLLNHNDGDAVSYNSNNTATYYNSGCQAPYIPLAVNAGLNQTICYNSQAVLSATPSGVYNSVTWSGGSGVFSSPTSLTTTYTPGVSEVGTVTLQCTITRSCSASTTSVSAVVNVSITSLPIFSLSATNGYSLCPSTSSVLSYSVINAANAGVITPSWTSPSGSGTTYTVSAPSGTSAVTYSLNLANSCGNTSQTFAVYPLALPTVSLSSITPTACSGSTLSLSASGNTGNYSWNNPLSTNSTVILTANTTTTGIVTSTNSCGSVSKTYTLTVTPIPTLTVNNSNISLCSGQSSTVTATSNVPSYTWQPGGVFTNTIVVNSAGVYTVNTSNVCGSASATVDVVVSSVPSLSLTSSSQSICASGSTATLSLSGSVGTYSWSNGSSSSTTSITLPGVYSATVTTSSCGSATASIVIGTVPLPTVSISVPTTTVCSGSALTFTANSSDSNYLWTGGVTTQTVSVNTTSIVVTTTNSCGSAQATQTIDILPLPTLTLSSNSISLCSGQTATVQATTNTAVTYSWSSGAITNSVSLNTAGVYSVEVTNACGNASETVSVTVGTSPAILASASQTLLCPGQTATLSLSGSIGTYSWSNGAATATTSVTNAGVYTASVTNSCGSAVSTVTIISQVTPSVSLSVTSSTICSGQTSTITAISNVSNFSWNTGAITNTIVVNNSGVETVTVSNSCGIATASIDIISASLPTINLSPTSYTICPSETATLTVTGGAAPYVWSNSSNTGSVITTNGGTVSVSNTNVCGTTTQTINVTVVTINASISANPTSGVKPVVVDFTNNSNGASTYLWDFGNGNSANTQTVSSQTYSVAGIYTVYLIASNGTCTDTDSLIITVLNEEPGLIIPNVFTPNNDSVNDVFRVTGLNIVDFNCVIFDRWGLQMFAWDLIKEGWDGKTDGKDVPAGTYFYIIRAKGIDDKEIKKQGAFSLFR